MTKRHTTINGKNVSFQVEGKGSVLVLLHGFLENIEIWESFSKQLSLKYKVVLIDLPGHGDTDIFAEKHSMELMADMVFSVLDYLQISKCVMIGHSMGGYVSACFAEKYPEKLNGIGFFHSHALADSPQAKIDRGRAIKIVKENHKDIICSLVHDLFTPENQTIFVSEIKHIENISKQLKTESIIAALEGMRHRTDKTKLLSTFNFPVMFIIGKQDDKTPLNVMIEQFTLPKHAEILLLDNVSHMGFIEAFDKTLSFVHHFVEICNK